MVRLVIGNSSSQFQNFTIKQHLELKKILKYEISDGQAFYSGSFHNKDRYLIDKKGKFPTGLLYLLSGWNADNKVEIFDCRVKPGIRSAGFVMMAPHSLYNEQEQAASAAVKAGRGIVAAVTASGKSTIIARVIERFQVKTLVIVPSLELKRQLTETFKQYFGSKKVGGQGFPIWVDNVDALSASPNAYKGYDAVIIDEFHHAAASTYRKLNDKAWNSIYYRIGFTATPFRSKETERYLLESILANVVYRITYQTAVQNGFIAPLEAFYFTLPVTKGGSARDQWATVYKRLVTDNEYRNKLIANLLMQLNTKKASTLCLVKEIAHGNKLSQLTGLHFIKGENEDNKEAIQIFNRGGHQVIGTTGVIGEGIDTKPCEWVIIAGLGKSRVSLMQQFGRGLRKYPGKDVCKVILFKDMSHKWTIAHFKEQCKILKEEYGVTPIKLENIE